MMTGLTADPYYQSAIDLIERYPHLSKKELDQLISPVIETISVS